MFQIMIGQNQNKFETQNEIEIVSQYKKKNQVINTTYWASARELSYVPCPWSSRSVYPAR